MRVNWEAGSTNEDNFEIDYGPSDTGPWTSLGTPTNTYVDVSGLLENTTYYFQVKAVNATGSSDYLAGNQTTLLLLPADPSNVTFTSVTENSMRVNWQDNSNNEANFEVDRGPAESGPWTSLGEPSVNYFDDSGLQDDTEYFYRVKAVNATGSSDYTLGSARTLLEIPKEPTKLKGEANTTCTVGLTWDDKSDNEVGFKIERSIFESFGYMVLDSVPENIKSYTDISTSNNSTYYYRVSAFNASGNSDFTSTSVAVSVVLDGGLIGVDQLICPDGDPNILFNLSSPSGGSGNWTHQWQSRIAPAVFTDISGEVGLSFDPPVGMMETTEFQRISTVECGSVASNLVTITVEDLESPVFSLCPNNSLIEINRDESVAMVETLDPVVTDNCEVQLLTWTLSGATTGNSPAVGINYLGTVEFKLGTTTVTYHAEDLEGNAASCTFDITIEIEKPKILDVSIPDASMKIGDIVTATIKVANDGGSNYSLLSGDIGGYPLTGFVRSNETTYLVNFEITEGGNSYLAGEDIPVGNLVVSDLVASSEPFNTSISQANDPLDAKLPVIYSLNVVSGDYSIGDQIVLQIFADGPDYDILPSSGINGLGVTQMNVEFLEIGGGLYNLLYIVEEGNTDVDPGGLLAIVALVKPSGNVCDPFTTVSNSENVSIDAHAPVIARMEVLSVEVGIGGTVQVAITADEDGYLAAPGTVINGIPISSPSVTFSEIGSGLYQISYVVQVGDNEVAPGELEMTLVMNDPAGNSSSPYNSIEPNLLEIYTDIPTVLLAGTPEVCEDESTELVVFLNGGRSPWSIDLTDGSTTTTYENIYSTELDIAVLPNGTTTYRITNVTDVNGVVNNEIKSFRIEVNPKTEVEIINLAKSYSVEADPVQLQASVPGGIFSGPGVFSSSGIFDPGRADTVNSPHLITYTYQNTNGCLSVDSALVFVLGGEGDIYIPFDVVCDDMQPFTVSASNVAGDTGTFVLYNSLGQSVPGITDNGDNSASIDPSLLAPDNYTIEYEYMDDVVLYLRVSFFVESVQTPVIISPDQFNYCQNDAPVALKSNVDGAVFSGVGVTGNATDGYMFDPEKGALGANIVTCEVTSANGCSKSTQMSFTVLFAPEVKFAMSSACISEEGTDILFSNLTSGKLEVETWDWNFGDPSSGELNESNLLEPNHFYSTSGQRRITLSASTSDGCRDEFVIDTTMGILPVADFIWITDCFKDEVKSQFMDRSTSGSSELESLVWTFRTSEGTFLQELGSSSSLDTIGFQFDMAKPYIVELEVQNADGCIDKTSRELSLRSTIDLDTTKYLEDFDNDQGMWTIHSDSTDISWTWDTPDFSGFQQISGDRAWFTQYPQDIVVYNEQSWVRVPALTSQLLRSQSSNWISSEALFLRVVLFCNIRMW